MTGRVVVVTNIPSPYQVELFDALTAAGINLQVIYAFRHEAARRWQARELGHAHLFIDDARPGAADAVRQADVCVFSMYRHPEVREWLQARAGSGAPWCFWGERPGARQTGLAGVWYRRWRLRSLRHSKAPIWGIGSWAVSGYRKEFGSERHYFNIPYFSDLTRFDALSTKHARTDASTRTLLFSGSLIRRKGVDLLAQAFAARAQGDPRLRLEILGFGDLEDSLRESLSGVADQVTVHGFKDWDELPQIYARADALVAPSRYDGWGLIIPEGLAAGLPVIGSDAMGAAWDLLEPGVNGWRVKARSLPALAVAVGEFSDMTDIRLAEMRDAARASVAHHQLADGVARFKAALDGTHEVF